MDKDASYYIKIVILYHLVILPGITQKPMIDIRDIKDRQRSACLMVGKR
jgi:hypothetical protein